MKSNGFDKSLRLLNASDYKVVFDSATFRVSSPEVLFLATENHRPQPRLGLVVAKKNAKLAVQRNRIKRAARESFRLQQHQLSGIDVVILARRGLDQMDNKAMQQLLLKLWGQLQRRVEKSRVKKQHAVQKSSEP